MKILFGIQATGNGHISRSREVLRYLKTMGHEVFVIFSGTDPSRLPDLDVFAPFQIKHGLTFRTDRGKLKFFKTAMHLHLVRFFHEVGAIDASGYDLVITDFEPLSARLAKRFKIPTIAFGHQYAFFYNVPMAAGYPFSRWVIRNFAAAEHAIGLHWYHFGFPILPPIVPEWLTAGNPARENKILVYLPFEHPAEVLGLLKPLQSYQFYLYGSGPIRHPVDQGHLHQRPYSREGFLQDLTECNGVICNAGFELLSEALHIGKKLLVKPLLGQMEQMSNALAVARLRLGRVMPRLNRREVESWLDSPAAPPMAYPAVARMIAEWIDRGNWHGTDRLALDAWSQTGGIDYLAFN